MHRPAPKTFLADRINAKLCVPVIRALRSVRVCLQLRNLNTGTGSAHHAI